MLNDFKRGYRLLRDSVTVFKIHPILALPIAVVAIIQSAVVVYYKYYLDIDTLSTEAVLGVLFGIVFFFTFSLTVACSLLVELIKHIETNQKTSLANALFKTLLNIKRLGIISFVWAIIDFILLIIQALLSRDREDPSDPSSKNIAATLSGQGASMSIWQYGIQLLRKKLRMVAFLTIPAVSWDDLNAKQAIDKSFHVVRGNFPQFFSGFLLTEAAAIIIFLVPGICFLIESKGLVEFSDTAWNILTLYCVIGTSVYYYLEQMFCAELYLWHRKFERAVFQAEKAGDAPPTRMSDVSPPSILDNIPDLEI